jgi:hypothetical protein
VNVVLEEVLCVVTPAITVYGEVPPDTLTVNVPSEEVHVAAVVATVAVGPPTLFNETVEVTEQLGFDTSVTVTL